MRSRLVVCATALVTVAATAGLAGATSSTGAASADGDRPAVVAWAACTGFLGTIGAECGSLVVPLDYQRPRGATISLALSRLTHTGTEAAYRGIMLTNPGGPGGSGLNLVVLKTFVPNDGGADYDWIGFDPRGVGASVPAITCNTGYVHAGRAPYVPARDAVEPSWLADARGYAHDCATHSAQQSALLAHMATADNVRDMESIRKALGSRLLNFYGFSYGTFLGQLYATTFPGRVGRMVLDSNVDPRRTWYRANLDQDVAFETVLKTWFGWIATYDGVYHLGTTPSQVESAYYRVLAQVQLSPGGGTIGPAEWSDAFLYAGYVQFLWPDLADAFSQAVAGDWAGADFWWQQTDGVGDDNGYAVYLATECSDAAWPTSWNRWRRDNWNLYDDGNHFLTWANASFNAPCTAWPVQGRDAPEIDGSSVRSPILLVDETLDAATPFTGSLEVRRLFPTSRLLAEPGGTTHAGSLGGNACVDDTIARYLKTGALPSRLGGKRADATCEPLPQPVPFQLQSATVSAVSHNGRLALLPTGPAMRGAGS
jgi:pimeloyl-ACP methyl ester carboxylesterase